jgi:S1-C subfamily serine protease
MPQRAMSVLFAVLLVLTPSCNPVPQHYSDEQLRGPLVEIEIIGPSGEMLSAGTGFVFRVSEIDGKPVTYILTARHVLCIAGTIVVNYYGCSFQAVVERLEARWLRASTTLDLAVLAVDGWKAPYVAPLTTRTSSQPLFLETIAAGRSPMGGLLVWTGIVNGNRYPFIFFTATIHPGCSGGPVLAKEDGVWKVVGMIQRLGIQNGEHLYHTGMALEGFLITEWLGTVDCP